MWQNVIPVSNKSLKWSLLWAFFNPFTSQFRNVLKYLKDNIFVIVGPLTKYSHFIGVSPKAKAILVVDSYVKNIFKLHRFPKFIIIDRDPKFTSNL